MTYVKVILRQTATIAEIRQLIGALSGLDAVYSVYTARVAPYPGEWSALSGAESVPVIGMDIKAERTGETAPVLEAYKRIIFRTERD